MQELCAKPQYGGLGFGKHAGAYCHVKRGEKRIREVGFGPMDASPSRPDVSRILQNPRFRQACFYRCFCNYGIENAFEQPKNDGLGGPHRRSSEAYQLRLDINDDFSTNSTEKLGTQGKRWVRSSVLAIEPEWQSFQLSHVAVSLARENEIKCHGPLPSFVLPPLFQRSDFVNLNHFCAVQWSGGNQ